MAVTEQDILWQDKDYLVIYKKEYRPVQDDKTGALSYLTELRNPSVCFPQPLIGPEGDLCHRLDRPVLGVLAFAKTAGGLAAFNRLLREQAVQRRYWAIVESEPPRPEGELKDLLVKTEKTNRSRALKPGRQKTAGTGAKESVLFYRVTGQTKRYWMLEVCLNTGRHHQIRVQLANMGCPVKGDVKYGARRTNPGGGIYLFAREIAFEHPFGGGTVQVSARPPEDILWNCFPQT